MIRSDLRVCHNKTAKALEQLPNPERAQLEALANAAQQRTDTFDKQDIYPSHRSILRVLNPERAPHSNSNTLEFHVLHRVLACVRENCQTH